PATMYSPGIGLTRSSISQARWYLYAELWREIGRRLDLGLRKRRRRIDDRNAFRARERQEFLNSSDVAIQPGRTARIRRIGPAVSHVDDNQRRVDTEAEFVLEDAALVVVSIDFRHGATQGIHGLHGQGLVPLFP